MNGFRVWSYHIEVLNDGKLTNSEDKTELDYYLNTIATRSVILYWHPSKSKQIGYCTLVRFNERSTIAPNGLFSCGSMIRQYMSKPNSVDILKINNKDNPILQHPIIIFVGNYFHLVKHLVLLLNIVFTLTVLPLLNI